MQTSKLPDDSDLCRDDYAATYCPEDNKLRLYTGRVERSTYDWLRALGYSSTPKQDCDFVAVWTPAREDAALALIGDGDDIGDEDQTPEDRAADRAERFGGYREKRRAEAHGYADTYDAGDDATGSQNAERAERQAARRDRTGRRACSQWSKAEYWQHRTAGVISHALHVSKPHVRRGRILRLEAEQRKHAATIERAQEAFDSWQRVLSLPDADERITFDGDGCAQRINSKALALAYNLANFLSRGWNHTHPRTGEVSSIDSHLTDTRDPITAREAATLALGASERPTVGRWGAHYELRLAYERQMIDAAGGSAADAEMEPGGLLGRYLITKVNKSRATGAVVSVNVWAPRDGNEGYDYRRRGDTMLINIQRMGESAYRPPTDASRAQLAEFQREQKAKTKKANAAKPKLINPTNEDAERLQAALNKQHEDKRKESSLYAYTEPEPTPVSYMTQAQYSARSKGDHGPCNTYYIRRGPVMAHGRYGIAERAPIVCKVRGAFPGGSFSRPYSVVVLTDKPQKPLPDWSPVEEAATVSA